MPPSRRLAQFPGTFVLDGLLLLLALLACYPNWFNMRVVSLSGDFFCAFLPYHFFNREVWNAGLLPFWNPYNFCGCPFAATLQSGSFYPFGFISVLWPTLLGGIKAFRVFHVWLFGFMIYLWLRNRYRHPRWGALAAAIMATCSAYVAGHGDHINQLASLAWIPAVLWAFQCLLQRAADEHNGSVTRSVLIFSLLLAVQYLTGHPQNVFYTLFLCLGYFVFWMLWGRAERPFLPTAKHVIPTLVFAGALGLALTALQLLPSTELAPRTYRLFDGYRHATAYSMPPRHVAQMLWPYWHGNPAQGFKVDGNWSEWGCYIGILALLNIIVAVSTRAFWRNRESCFFLVMAIVILVLSFGSYTPLYKVFYIIFNPVVRHLRAPPRILGIHVVCFAYLLSNSFSLWPQWFKAGFEKRGIQNPLHVLPMQGMMLMILIAMFCEFAWFQQKQGHHLVSQLDGFKIPFQGETTNATINEALHYFNRLVLEKMNTDNYTHIGQPDLQYVRGRLINLSEYLSNFISGDSISQALDPKSYRLFRLTPRDPEQYRLPAEIINTSARGMNLSSRALFNWEFSTFIRKQMILPNLHVFSKIRSIEAYEEGLAPTIRFQDFLSYYNRNLRNQNPDRGLLHLLGVQAVLFEFFEDQYPNGFEAQNPQDFEYVMTAPWPELKRPLGWYGGIKDARPIAQWLFNIDPRINLPALEGPFYASQGNNPPQLPINRSYVNYFTANANAPWGLSDLPLNPGFRNLPIEIDQTSPTRLRISWDAPLQQPQLLWISQATYPGWKARAAVEEQFVSARLLEANAIGYLAECPKNSRSLEIYYDPGSYRTGIFITLCATALWFGLAVVFCTRKPLWQPAARQ